MTQNLKYLFRQALMLFLLALALGGLVAPIATFWMTESVILTHLPLIIYGMAIFLSAFLGCTDNLGMDLVVSSFWGKGDVPEGSEPNVFDAIFMGFIYSLLVTIALDMFFFVRLIWRFLVFLVD